MYDTVGSMKTTESRFWSKVEKTPGCWLWKAGAGQRGGGVFQVGGKCVPARRVSWEMAHPGKIVPKRVLVMCGNQMCVNPDHLTTDTSVARFWNNIRKGEECWEWVGAKNHGYGVLSRGGRNGANVLAHRMSYEINCGDPGGLVVCHRCDNPSCVRPDHLFLGTQMDNMKDMHKKGRNAYGDAVASKGTCHPQAVLNEEKVIEARIRKSKGEKVAEIAGDMGVSESAMKKAVNGYTWKHVPMM